MERPKRIHKAPLKERYNALIEKEPVKLRNLDINELEQIVENNKDNQKENQGNNQKNK